MHLYDAKLNFSPTQLAISPSPCTPSPARPFRLQAMQGSRGPSSLLR